MEALEQNDEGLSELLQDAELMGSAQQTHVDEMWRMKREITALQSELSAAQQRLQKFQNDRANLASALLKSTQSSATGANRK